jgi:hypothetical protein
MVLNQETVAAYKTLITEPAKHGLIDIIPVTEFFEKSEKVTAKHILAKAYMDHVARDLPKVILYIIMDEIFGICDGKDEDGLLGYHLTPKKTA